jgi:hypothetical protein
MKQCFKIAIYSIIKTWRFQNNRFIKTYYRLLWGKDNVLRLWNRKNSAVRKWRSRAWSIDPKVTNLTIITAAAANFERLEILA